ncbi:hypothetical protein [uncultured Thiodictyon sp.]|uniref:hypothetical protein n=1 Tax=uncultured Thiodictyon sp. TaxID=1846217 RepID=UPI0025E59FAB|nr:hypothetical protein [uncultured Thiodictyon sp.]
MAETELLWHQACDILHLHGTTRENGWPDSLNIEQIAQLHFDGDKVRERALLSMLRTEIKKGRLRVSGADHIRGIDHSEAWLIQQLGGCSKSRSPRDIPKVSREAYAQWQDRHQLTESPLLRGWIALPDAQRPTAAVPDTANMVAWRAVMLESWWAIMAEHGPNPAARAVLRWLKKNGPRDKIPEHQPDRDVLHWIDSYYSPQTVTLKTLSNCLYELRTAGKIPA